MVCEKTCSNFSDQQCFVQHDLLCKQLQLVISLVYLIFNALLSCLLVNDEFTHFAISRKSLRVSFPEGIQRSTFHLYALQVRGPAYCVDGTSSLDSFTKRLCRQNIQPKERRNF